MGLVALIIDLTTITLTTIISETISGLIVGLILAITGYIFLDRNAQRISFAEKMSLYGFTNFSLERQSPREIARMCNQASLIKIINVSGFHFLNANRPYITEALNRGCEVRFLCARPDSRFLRDIEIMENNTFDSSGKRLRELSSHIGDEVCELTKEYKALGMKVRYYSSEYRLPFVLAYYPDGSKKAWLTMTLPPYKSTHSFVLRGDEEAGRIYSSEINFMEMMETNFDAIWEYGSIAAENYFDNKSLECKNA